MKTGVTALSLAAATLLADSSLIAQQHEHFLDLTTVPSIRGALIPVEQGNVPPTRRLGPGAIIVSPHSPVPMSPFSLTIERLTLDRLTYTGGEPFVYEVHLRNTGKSAVAFPWSIDASLFEASAPDSYVMVLGLRDANDRLSVGEIGSITIYGAPSVPGSLEQVLPHETVVIRVKTDWMAREGEKRMQVVLQPTYRSRQYPHIVSKNSIVVYSRGRGR